MSTTLTSNTGRVLAFLMAFLSLLATGCGLNEQERAVSDVNAGIQAVRDAETEVADAIAAQESDNGERDVPKLETAVESYLEAVDALNASVRALGEMMPTMTEHIRSEFMPKAEEAARACQSALDVLRSEQQVDDTRLREAITSLGACVEQYAVSVNGVSTKYGQVSE